MPDPLIINSLRGGLNNADHRSELERDQCVIVENIDFSRGALGGRRRGTGLIDTTTGTYAQAGECDFLFQHFPSGDFTQQELWAVSWSAGVPVISRATSAWETIAPSDTFLSSGQYKLEAQSLHGKMFLTGPLTGALDRMLVWDPRIPSLRRAGFATTHTASTVANQGAGAYAATPRYFRTRWIQQSAGINVRRSEPVNCTTFPFTPSGAGLAARITRGAAPGEGETHWEVEAGLDGVTFYRIATVVLATTTFDDTNAPASYASFVQSEAIGQYVPLYAAKYMCADEDRLLLGGHWTDTTKASRVSWTPVFGATGIGNDERIVAANDPYVDLDNFDGGELTDLAGPLNGYVYAFKWEHIYKLIRQHSAVKSYEAILLTSKKGALPRSVIPGFDATGNPCLYFLDPTTGPNRLGINGIEECGADIQGTWDTVNVNAATVVSHGIYYPDKKQVWWWLCTDGSNVPTVRITVYIKAQRVDETGRVRGGWSLDNGNIAQAFASCMFADNVTQLSTVRSLKMKPLIGIRSATAAHLIQQCDVNTQDNGVNYRARVRTKPFMPGWLIKKTGVFYATLLATAKAGAEVTLRFIRNFGQDDDDLVRQVDLSPKNAEDTVAKPLDEAGVSDMLSLEVELGDDTETNTDWELHLLAMKLTDEEDAG